ncbi:hypothetical protein [Croceibacterium aestuarii]|uniref:hypothetical protein n=1 Tax=Croceibacterium aestuarii TaxID=3064139 RepID=UPI00272E8921|nr:hypothetical protein [Croceibacterium sp. D39]
MVAVLIVFALGVANFALHKAVLESGHPMLRQMPWFGRGMGGRATLAVEFIVLLGALLLAASGFTGWGRVYAGYTAMNGFGAWLVLTHRI